MMKRSCSYYSNLGLRSSWCAFWRAREQPALRPECIRVRREVSKFSEERTGRGGTTAVSSSPPATRLEHPAAIHLLEPENYENVLLSGI